MKSPLPHWLFVSLTALSVAFAPDDMLAADGKPKPDVPPEDDYKPTSDSLKQAGVPVGKTFQFVFTGSKIFPGTSRNITVYIPAQYKGDKPACVYIGLDGLGFAAPVVFDNIIHKNEMPVTIGIGVQPGGAESMRPPENPRFNRSFEFDGLNENLGRFLIEEIFPEVERHKTPDGLPILLSKNPNDRCTGGGSTGGIAAFTLAWEHPDEFRRVFTAIGTFVGMRGGDRYPVLVRKTEPKPIRIFMQDGENDEWMGGPEVGDWWMGNLTLQRALEFAGYQVQHVWGKGIHSGRHATAVFPDAMRYLWKYWPQPVKAGESQNTFLKAILLPGEDWQLAADGITSAAVLAANPRGEIIYRETNYKKIKRLDGGEIAINSLANAIALGADGKLFIADAIDKRIIARDEAGKIEQVASGIQVRSMIVTNSACIYAVAASQHVPFSDGADLWLIRPNGEKLLLDKDLNRATAIALSPDGLWLVVAEETTLWGYSWRVQPDGTLKDKQKYYWFHVPDWAEDSGVRAWRNDRDGRLYAATRMGVQVFDRNGRVRAILPLPEGEVIDVCFGGASFDTLFAVSAGKIYKRKLKSIGAPSWLPAIKLPPWGAG
ncbi:MAG: alpha/beta hydrolase-fold protein [Candidatus Sumerlaeota bacterium]|nr:alpha/beta hydrolase-fold protein [Candidatus Sumerlaeota bacterium]